MNMQRKESLGGAVNLDHASHTVRILDGAQPGATNSIQLLSMLCQMLVVNSVEVTRLLLVQTRSCSPLVARH